MITRNPYIALGLTTLVGIAIIIVLYLTANDPGPPPETEEERFERVHTVFIEAFTGGAAWAGRVEPLGLQSSRTAAHTPGWQINGTGGSCDASGSYIVRDNPANALAITAPHSQFDAHTGELAQLLFEDTAARGAAWNTAPRRATEQCESGLDLTTDRWHPFSSFALAFADSHRGGLLLQLHGLEETGPLGGEGSDLGIVLSGTGDAASGGLSELAACLRGAVAPFAVQVSANASDGRVNAQGRVLLLGGHGGFAHAELALPLRTQLLEDNALRAEVAQCLISAAQS